MSKIVRAWGAAGLAVLLLSACSGDRELEYQEKTVYEIYSRAMTYLDNEQFRQSAQWFDEVERQHPYSIWATKAKLMAAYSHYQANRYEDAVAALDRFIQVHPGNRDIGYAYYLKALCFYEQITDVHRDQEMTVKALEALEDLSTRFPDSPYARDARLKIDLTRDHLAGKEMAVGRFYLQRKAYLAAINRFKVVVEQYGTTSHAPEALYRLAEAYIILGVIPEARKAAAVLGFNYPSSDWYRDAYQLVEGREPPETPAQTAQSSP